MMEKDALEDIEQYIFYGGSQKKADIWQRQKKDRVTFLRE